jgi:hypothetical protein
VKRISRPCFGIGEIVGAIVPRSNRQRAFAAARATFIAAENDYIERSISSLFAISTGLDLAGLTTLDMAQIYKVTFRQGSSARKFRDQLLANAPHGTCPLCMKGVASTIDHYLAKSIHPEFAVTPINLVPACADCNRAKLDRHPTSAGEQTFHPYFDTFDEDTWIRATIEAGSSPLFVYRVDPPSHWSQIQRERAATHFKTFELGKLYAIHAGQEMASMAQTLKRHASRGDFALKEELELLTEDRRATDPNSWQAAMYEAMAESDWFRSTGLYSV